MKKFDCFLGIDQTGSVTSTGSPKPLPVFAIVATGKSWRALYPHTNSTKLHRFQYSKINQFIHDLDIGPMNRKQILILVDCVLGLPMTLNQSGVSPLEQIKNLMRTAGQSPRYGLQAGQAFFTELLAKQNLKPRPRRHCEIELQANSVFTHQPFQKNIQTGTFRIWKDLGEDQESLLQFQFWPFEPLNSHGFQTIVAEGYPSLAWQKLGDGQRNSTTLERILSRFHKQIDDIEGIKKLDKDHQDAALLAIWGWFTTQNGYPYDSQPSNLEGGIWGQNFKTDLKTTPDL